MDTFFEKHPSMLYTLKGFVIIVLIVLAANILGIFRNDTVNLVIEDELVTIYYNEEALVQFTKDEIVSVELLDTLDFGSAVEDLSAGGYVAGVWENDAWGAYILCVKQDVESYVLLETDENVFVFNYMNESTTEGLYEGLVKW